MLYWQWVIEEVCDVEQVKRQHRRMLTNLYSPQAGEVVETSQGTWRSELLQKFPVQHAGAAVELTLREAQCAYYAMSGQTFKEIARELLLSPRTIEYYLRRIRKKLDCRTMLDVLKILNQCEFAKQCGFEEAEEPA